jgi:hypothetical protein
MVVVSIPIGVDLPAPSGPSGAKALARLDGEVDPSDGFDTTGTGLA